MKKILMMLFVIGIISFGPAYGHKLISHDDAHRDFESALEIPDHKVSWAIYENLGANEAKFYSFDAKEGDSFYASIVIPKINGLEYYSPTLILVGNGDFVNKKIPYEEGFPGNEFYEPFGQVTYWERQELKTEIPADGKYFIVVMDEKNQNGKYSLAIGTIEDFSGADFFTILPKAWFDTKIFVNDYASIGIFFFVLISIFTIPILMLLRKKSLASFKKYF
jgi:hypothetical protein